MGALYLACQGEHGMEKLCVIKTVLPGLADKEYVARFRDEAKVVVKLSHGNLVPVFDAGMAGGPRRRRDVPGDGLRRRQGPARRLEPLRQKGDRVSRRRRGVHRRQLVPRAASRALDVEAQAGAPRRLAAEHPVVVLRRGEADRLRAGVVDAQDREDRARRGLRQGQLHVARAGARRDARRAHRSLRGRHHLVGAAHRAAALPAVGAQADSSACAIRTSSHRRPTRRACRRRSTPS